MRLSARIDTSPVNLISRKRAEFEAAGIYVTDLTDTNPTRHGLFGPHILDILSRHTERAARYDPTPRGPWPARAALAERYGGDPDDYWLTASTSEAYGWLFTVLADSGSSVAIPSPGYPLIEPLARQHDLTTASYHTCYVHPTGWELDRDSFERLSTRVVVAVHPNNPTGAYMEPWIAEACARKRIPLIADEVFYPFRLGRPTHVNDPLGHGETSTRRAPTAATAVSLGTPPRLSGNDATLTFGLDGLSKSLAAPQLKLGWIRLSGPTLQRKQAAVALDQIADTYLSVNAIVALALPELLTLADSSITRITSRLNANLSMVREIFPDLRVRAAHGGWVVLLDVPHILDADDLCLTLMERAGLYVHPGYFYDLSDSTLAISLLPEEQVFRESCERLKAALQVIDAEQYSPTT